MTMFQLDFAEVYSLEFFSAHVRQQRVTVILVLFALKCPLCSQIRQKDGRNLSEAHWIWRNAQLQAASKISSQRNHFATSS